MVGFSAAITKGAIETAVKETPKEIAKETAKEVAKKPFEQAGEFKNPFARTGEPTAEGKSNLTKPTLEGRVEAAAHDASEFYKIPAEDLYKGDALETFKECGSINDVLKNIEHEGGRNIAQQEFSGEPWARQLLADFFAGARSEMRGLPKSGFEDKLASTKGSLSHPNGTLRVQANQFGREVVQNLQKEGIEPTVENCKEAFISSRYAEMSGRVKMEIKNLTGYSDGIVNYIRTIEEAKVYVDAGLVEGKVNGKPALLNPRIDGSACYNPLGLTNKERAAERKAPIDKNGRPIQLHHIGKEPDSPLAELTREQHQSSENNKILHSPGISKIDRTKFDELRKAYWQERSKTL